MRAQGRARAGHHLPFYVWIFFCLRLPLSLSPASSINRASLDPGGPRAARATGHATRGGTSASGLRPSKNEMRPKERGRPSSPRLPPSLPPSFPRSLSRRRGMGVLMSTYLGPGSFEQNTEVARREQCPATPRREGRPTTLASSSLEDPGKDDAKMKTTRGGHTRSLARTHRSCGTTPRARGPVPQPNDAPQMTVAVGGRATANSLST